MDVRNYERPRGRTVAHWSASSTAFGCAVAALVGLALAACKADSCDPALVNVAMTFMKEHQSCVVNDDCVTVSDFCGALPHGDCGALVMNREGEASAQWADITKELKECAPDECTVCGAALVPGCSNGSCGGP